MIVTSMLILGGLTFFYRYAFISLMGKKLSDRIPTALLQLLAPATFAAIIFNNLLFSHSESTAIRPRLIIATLALALAFWTESILITLIFGLTALYFF